MDNKKIAFEEWVNLVIFNLENERAEILTDPTKRKPIMKELQLLTIWLNSFDVNFPTISKEELLNLTGLNLLKEQASTFTTFFDEAPLYRRHKPGRKKLPRAVIELLILGFEFTKGSSELQIELAKCLVDPKKELSPNKEKPSYYGAIFQTHLEVNKTRHWKFGDLPQVPADLAQIPLWIGRTKDLYYKYMIDIYTDLKKIGYMNELKYLLPPIKKDKRLTVKPKPKNCGDPQPNELQQSDSGEFEPSGVLPQFELSEYKTKILNILIARYKFAGFIEHE